MEGTGGETPLPDSAHPYQPAPERGVSVRLCRGDGVSAGTVMGDCSQVRPYLCASVCARVFSGRVCSEYSAHLAR